MKKILPWVDVTCAYCGCLADGSGYYHKGIISQLKKSTKNWKIDETGACVCPNCFKEREEE